MQKLNKLLLIGFFFTILLISSVSFVGASMLTSEANVTYDSNLIKVFEDENYANSLMNDNDFIGLEIINNQTFARITVFLRDNSEINVFGVEEERDRLTDDRIDWFSEETDKIIKSISEDEIKEIDKHPEGFRALVSEEAFDKLLKDERILKISWEQYKPKLINSDLEIKNTCQILVLIFFLLIIVLIHFTHKNRRKKNGSK